MKRALLLFFAIIVISIFSITSSAHSGRTDSAGGHNASGGGYHYHHGYSAHNHYDMDGDGIAEYCPYNDDTESEHGEAQILKPRETTKTTTSTDEKTKQSKDDSTEFDIKRYIGALFGAVLLSFIPTAFAFGLVAKCFGKHLSEKTETSVAAVLWVVIIIIISVIIYGAG